MVDIREHLFGQVFALPDLWPLLFLLLIIATLAIRTPFDDGELGAGSDPRDGDGGD